MQRLVLQIQLEHEAGGELPTSGRFVFYEMETAGLVRKSSRVSPAAAAATTPASRRSRTR
jgi:hypothetical protein